MAKNKFTFKTSRPTGSYAWLHKPSHQIKFKGQWIGSIEPVLPYSISLMVMKANLMEDGNPNCNWRWITLACKSESLVDAKAFLNNNIDAILTKYKIKTSDK